VYLPNQADAADCATAAQQHNSTTAQHVQVQVQALASHGQAAKPARERP